MTLFQEIHIQHILQPVPKEMQEYDKMFICSSKNTAGKIRSKSKLFRFEVTPSAT